MPNNAPAPLLPFRLASRQHFTQVGTVPYTSGAKLQSIRLPQVGWLAALVVRVFGTATGGAGTATYVNAVEQAFNLISRFQLNGNGGNINLMDVSGFDAYLISHLGLERGFKLDAGGVGSSAVDPTLVKTPLTTNAQVVSDFALTYILPVNANQGLNFETGLINLQAQDAFFNLEMTAPATSAIYATNAPTFSSMNVEVSYLWYEMPDPTRVNLPPPLICRTVGQDSGLAVVNGDNLIVVPRAGILMQAITAIKIDGAYSSTAIDQLAIKLNLNSVAYQQKGYQNRLWNRIQHAVDFPAGVNAFDFYHASQSVSEGDSRDMFDLEQYSTFQIIATITGMTTPSTSNIRTIYRTLQQLS
jgi:hypothetical protein